MLVIDMRVSKWGISAAAAAGIFALAVGAARAQALTDFNKFYQDGFSFYGAVSGLVMERNHAGGGAIVAANPATTTSFTTGRDLDFNTSTGIDATFGIRFWRTEAVEIRFMNFDSDGSHSFLTPGGFIGAGFTGPANTLFQGQAQTKMESWEVNWRHQLFEQLTVLAGYRQINVSDNLHYAINTTIAFGEYDYSNKLRGPQIGAEWAFFPMANPLQVNVIGKIGRYSLDTAGGISEFQGAGHTFIGSFGTSDRDHVYGSEVDVLIGYRLSNNVIVRAGYTALWLNSLGLASNNASASLTNPSLLNATVYRGDLFLQGVNFGLAIGY